MAKTDNETTTTQAAGKRTHRATFARDKYTGGYNVRVEGPNARAFAGRAVPITRMNGDETSETLDKLIWSGVDEKTGVNVALYSFEQKPRENKNEEVPF